MTVRTETEAPTPHEEPCPVCGNPTVSWVERVYDEDSDVTTRTVTSCTACEWQA